MSDFAPQIGPPEKAMGAMPPAPPPEVPDGPGPEVVEVVPDVTEETVRSILTGVGNVASIIDHQPAAPDLWKFRDDELDQLVPALTRHANRNEVLRRALLHGDLVVIAMALGQYSVRNISIRKEITRERHPDEADRAARQAGGIAAGSQPGWGQPDADRHGYGAALRTSTAP